MAVSSEDTFKILSELKCGFCHEFPNRRQVFQCTAGHPVCDLCIRTKDVRHCPECETPEPLQYRCLLMENLANLTRHYMTYNDPITTRQMSICKMLGFSTCDFAETKGSVLVKHLLEYHEARRLKRIAWNNFDSAFYKPGRSFKLIGVHQVAQEENKTCHYFITLVRLVYEENTGDHTFSCVTCHAEDSSNESYTVKITLYTSKKKTLCEWSGPPTDLKNALEDITQPPFSIPVKYFMKNAHRSGDKKEFDLNLHVSIQKTKPLDDV